VVRGILDGRASGQLETDEVEAALFGLVVLAIGLPTSFLIQLAGRSYNSRVIEGIFNAMFSASLRKWFSSSLPENYPVAHGLISFLLFIPLVIVVFLRLSFLLLSTMARLIASRFS